METNTQAAALAPASADPSHKERRHHKHKKASDPFMDLQDDAIKLPDQPSPNDGNDRDGTGAASSLLADLVLTPISMTALLLSLFVVDHEQRKWRLSQHAAHPESLWAKISTYFNPEPYDGSSDRAVEGENSGGTGSFSGWYTRKKHRAMAKLELSDALEMRGRVVIALAAWVILGVSACVYAARRLFAWMLA